MAMNPMQRKIRNSFLFGFLVAVIIAAVVVALLYMRVKGLKAEIVKIQKENQVALTQVYAITTDAQKDEILTETDGVSAKVGIISVPSQQVPDNAITPANIDDLYKDDSSDEYQMTDCVLCVRKEDLKYADDLKKACALPIEVEEGQQIQLGGFIIENKTTNVVVDESLDSNLEAQKDWFYKTSGLMIK